jgi:membrane fusion protein (multidrug efflux system)
MAETPIAEPVKVRTAPKRKFRFVRLLVFVTIFAALVVGGVYMWNYFNAYESTDDAQIDGHINAISARITGNVIDVRAEDEQVVKAGEVLVRIDPRDYEVAVAKAEADLHDAEAALESVSIFPLRPPIQPVS